MTQRNFDGVRIVSNIGTSKLYLPELQRDFVNKIIRYENARSKVYGSWNSQNEKDDNSGNKKKSQFEQKASINLFAGTRGSGEL